MSNATCFDPGTLQDYLLGRLSDEQSDAIATHLEACLSCEATISQLDRASDTLTNGLRLPPVAAEPATDDALQKALDRVQSLEPDSVASRSTEADPFGERKATILRDYQLLEPLGSGGMGTVYKAVHTRLDRLVAVKLLPARRLGDEQAVARFQREMRVIGQLSHPAIVQATDAGEVDGTHFLVMEFVEGFDLNTIAKACGPLSIANACEITRQAAIGLEYAHQQGIVHRDIKPSNLMLSVVSSPLSVVGAVASNGPRTTDHGPTLKILDLGLALLSGEQAPVDELTTVGQLMGTLDYMAPEQLEDSHLVGPRADIYALAATLYRLLTGAAPFAKDDRKTPLQKLRALATETVTPIRERRADLPVELAVIIDRALCRDPSERFASMSEFAEVLAPWCVGHDLVKLARTASAAPPFSLSTWERVGVREPSVIRPHLQKDAGGSGPHVEDKSRTSVRVPHPAFGHPLPEGEGTGTRRWSRWIALSAFVGFIALGVIVTLQTNKGTLIVESVRDGVEVRVKSSGRVVEQLEISKTAQSTKLVAGEYEVELVGDADGLQLQNGKFVLKRGDTIVAKVTEIPKSQTPVVGMTGAATESPVEPRSQKPVEIVDRRAKGMETFEASNLDLAGAKKIRESLQKRINIEFSDQPFTDCLAYLQDQAGVEFFLDKEALTEEGLAPDTPCHLRLNEVRLTTALDFLLRPLRCTWVIDQGQVLITTKAKEGEHLVTRSYPVGRLLPGVRQAVERMKSEAPPLPPGFGRPGAGGGFGGGSGGGFFQINDSEPEQAATRDSLLIHRQFGGGGFGGAVAKPQQQNPNLATFFPSEGSHFKSLLSESLGYSWLDTQGEGGNCELLHNVLVVRHTWRAHADIEALLRAIEAAFLKPLTEPIEIRPAGYSLESDAKLREQLAHVIEASFADTPLTDVAEWLGDKFGVPVLLETDRLTETGIATDTPVTLQFKSIPGDVLLSRMLDPLQLDSRIEHGLLVITTKEFNKERHVTKIYDVRDLFARGLHPSRLVTGLTATTNGPWQATDGEGGTIVTFADTLLAIRHTSKVHDEVLKSLTSLRSQLSDQPETPFVVENPPPSRDVQPPVEGTATEPKSNSDPTSTTAPPKPETANQPRYDGKTFDEWLTMLDVERSPARLADAFQALRLLYQDHQSVLVAERVLKVFRLADPSASYGDSPNRQAIVSDAQQLFAALPAASVETAARMELSNGNSRSRGFVFSYVLSRSNHPMQSADLSRAVLNVSRDNDVSVRTAALSWLAHRQAKGDEAGTTPGASQRLRESLADKATEVAFWAAYGLLDSESDTAAVVETLIRIIGTPAQTASLADTSMLQGEAIKLVALMGPRASNAAPAIAPFLLLRDSSDGQRGFHVGQSGGPGSIQLSIKSLAALALARMGKSAASTLPTIEEALKSFGDPLRPTPDPASRSFGAGGGSGFNPMGMFGGGGPRNGRSPQVSLLELLIAAKARLEDRPAAEPNSKPAEVKVEDVLLVQSLFKLMQAEQILLEGHYGSGAERPELRELDRKLKAAEEELNVLQKLYNEQRKNSLRRTSGSPLGGKADDQQQ